MAMDSILYNPTNEHMEPMVGGKPYVFSPKKKMMVNGRIANHIINEYGRRGMVSLAYGDDTAEDPNNPGKTIEQGKAERGKKLNKDFKRQMVISVNQLNEGRKQEGKKYVKPTDQVKGYAKELGFDLLSPYTVADAKSAEIAVLQQRNDDLMAVVTSQKAQTDKLMVMVEKLTASSEKDNVLTEAGRELSGPEIFKINARKQFNGLGKTKLGKFTADNLSEIQAWPDDLIVEFQSYWRQKIPNKRCPV